MRKNIIMFLWKRTIVRQIFWVTSLFFTKVCFALRLWYLGVNVFCFNYRFTYNDSTLGGHLNSILKLYYERYFNSKVKQLCQNESKVYRSFLKTEKRMSIVKEFSDYGLHNMLTLRYPKDPDDVTRLGDMMVLKRYIPKTGEKGILILHYNESFSKFASIYDFNILSLRYTIVLEPSWWGYQQADLLMFLSLKTSVVVQCPYLPDYNFIESIKGNFFPIKLGAGDWVDNETFKDGRNFEKYYDIVYIGNWSEIKRHKVLFKAMSNMKTNGKVALIGYPHSSRTTEDILMEASQYGVEAKIAIFENISPAQVSKILMQSKVNVLMSKGEGANRGIYEGLFSGNVIVLYRHNKGVNSEIINSCTGFYADDDELGSVLDQAIKKYSNYRTSEWASKHTGYKNSSKKLNDFLKKLAQSQEEEWTVDIVEKVNRPNNRYLTESARLEMLKEIKSLEECKSIDFLK